MRRGLLAILMLAIFVSSTSSAVLTEDLNPLADVSKIDGDLIESDFILLLIQNTCTGGDRLSLAPKAQVDDGKMDLGVIYHIGRLKVLKLFNLLKAQGAHVWNPNVEFYNFKKLRIETEEPTAINIDGENIGTTPLEMEVKPSAIKIFH